MIRNCSQSPGNGISKASYGKNSPFNEIPIKLYYRPKELRDQNTPSLDMIEHDDFQEDFEPERS